MTANLSLSVVSLNVGLPRSVRWKNRIVVTGIYKEPIAGPVLARQLNLGRSAGRSNGSRWAR